MDGQPDLAARIEKLRRDIFWMRCVLLVSFLFLAAGAIANWTKHPKTVEANEFLLKDQSGNVVARLGRYDLGDTCLTLTAKQNISSAELCVQDGEGSSLDLHNMKSESRATLTPSFKMHEPSGRFDGGLTINDAINQHFASINLGPDPKLIMGQDWKSSVSISSRAGEPKITLFGANEKPIWSSR